MRKAGLLCLLLLFALFLPALPVGAVEQNDVHDVQRENYEEKVSEKGEAGAAKEGKNGTEGEKPSPMFQIAPFIYGQQTFVPLRELGRLLHFNVDWNAENEEIIISKDNFKLTALAQNDHRLVVQERRPEVPGGPEHDDTFQEPYLWEYRKLDGHIFVPLRSMAQVFSWRIGWDAEKWAVRLWTEDAARENHQPTLSFHVEQQMPQEAPKTSAGRTAYLTFDDGPSREITPRILDVLKKENVPATFFVTGANAEKHPDIIHRIHNEGHTIGNHTYSHLASIIYASPQAFMQEVHKTENIIYDITGERTRILRAPYGSYPNLTEPFRKAVAESGYKYVDWNVDSMDSRNNAVPVETIVNAVKQQVPGKNRVFILFHDLPAKTTTALALPDIITFLRESQYTFKALTYDVDMVTHR